jgi:hypothetical protein
MAPLLIPLAMELGQFVPGILKLLTGSDKVEEIAGKVVDVARAVTGIDDPKFAVEAIQADPAKMMEFQLAMGAQQADVLAGAALLLVIICLAVVVWNSGADDFAKATISLILGRALGWVEQLFSFEFGTTRASKAKDDTINRLSGP